MTTWSSIDDLTISDEEVNYYKLRVNGVGLVITGCTQVLPNGQGFTNEFAGYSDDFIPSLRKLADAAKSGGAPAILQIFHAGDRSLPGLDKVSASVYQPDPTPFGPSAETRALPHEEILATLRAFGDTTRRAIEAGFDGVEIHGAHGFLIQNFWSPSTNQRTDEWGGSLENRLRFPLAIIEEIKSVIEIHATKPFMVGYRLSPEESSKEDGLRMSDTYKLIDFLVEQNPDYIHASLDHVASKPVDSQDEKTRLELIVERANGKVPVLAAGSILTPDDALKAMETGLPLFATGHALITDPDWVEKVENGREAEVETTLDTSKLDQLHIPGKLWDMIQMATGWFTIKK